MVLDTDILSAIMRQNPTVIPNAQAYLDEHRQFTLSIITRFEILRGLKARNAARQQQSFDAFGDRNLILPLTDEIVVQAAEIYADLYRRGALVYYFDTPEGSLFYQDTSGHWRGMLRDLRPDVAIVAAAGRGNIDGEPIQGSLAQFVAREVEMLRPRRVVLSHHDDWMPGFSRALDIAPIRAEMGLWAPRSELVEMGYLDGCPIFK